MLSVHMYGLSLLQQGQASSHSIMILDNCLAIYRGKILL